MNPRIEYFSSAFVNSKMIPVLMKDEMKMAFMMYYVYCDFELKPIFEIRFMFSILIT